MERTFEDILNRDAPANPLKIDTPDTPVMQDISTEPVNEDKVGQGIGLSKVPGPVRRHQSCTGSS